MLKTLRPFFNNTLSRTIGLIFLINSIMFGSWVTRIPDIKQQLNLSEGQLGIALLGISIGGLLMMPLTPRIMSKISVSKTILITTILTVLSILLPSFAPNFPIFILSLFTIGIMVSSMDVAMNAGAAMIEKEENVTIMSTCHGMFSLGGMIGAVVGSFIAGFGVSVPVHFMLVALLMLILVAILYKPLQLIPNGDIAADKMVFPKGKVFWLALIGLCIMIGEGAIADWSAIYLKQTLNSSAYLAGIGFAGFSATMTIGRFLGDGIIPKLGAITIVRWGSFIGAMGILLAIIVPYPITAIIGFSLVGIGFSCIVPILFSAAAKVEGISSSVGIASVTTAGFFGFLVGPPLIGFIANEAGLRFGLGLVFVLAILAFAIAKRVN